MANVNIPALTTLGTPDRTADLLEVYKNSGGVNSKSTVNNLLGITGAPVGTTDSQNITTKVLDNTNTVTLKDTLFTLQDDGDTTKQARFQLSGITTATTRTYTLPNASDTLVGQATTDTLTNKTLTSPTINTATISNPTLSVDSIAGFSSSTIASIAGLSVSSGVLNTNNSVKTSNIQDTAVTPAKLQAGSGTSWTWTTFTPSWTNYTRGNGTSSAAYTQIGKFVFGYVREHLGTTSVMGSAPYFAAPVSMSSLYNVVDNQSVGHAHLQPASLSVEGYFITNNAPASSLQMVYVGVSGAYTNIAGPTASTPGAWANNNYFSGHFWYQAA